MKEYYWYLIFNITEFLALNIGSKLYNLNLEGIGQADFTVLLGNETNVMYLDECLPVTMYDRPLYEKLNYAVYRDDETGNVWFGFLVPDED